MKRSKFLSIIGISAIAPVAAAKALEEWPEECVDKPNMITGEEYFNKHFIEPTPVTPEAYKGSTGVLFPLESGTWPRSYKMELEKHKSYWDKVERKTLFNQ